jgi:hypothetical protein
MRSSVSVPVVGDVAMAVVASIRSSSPAGTSSAESVQTRMAMNLLLDWAVGEVPLLAMFDVAFKANLKTPSCSEKRRNRAERGGGL